MEDKFRAAAALVSGDDVEEPDIDVLCVGDDLDEGNNTRRQLLQVQLDETKRALVTYSIYYSVQNASDIFNSSTATLAALTDAVDDGTFVDTLQRFGVPAFEAIETDSASLFTETFFAETPNEETQEGAAFLVTGIAAGVCVSLCLCGFFVFSMAKRSREKKKMKVYAGADEREHETRTASVQLSPRNVDVVALSQDTDAGFAQLQSTSAKSEEIIFSARERRNTGDSWSNAGNPRQKESFSSPRGVSAGKAASLSASVDSGELTIADSRSAHLARDRFVVLQETTPSVFEEDEEFAFKLGKDKRLTVSDLKFTGEVEDAHKKTAVVSTKKIGNIDTDVSSVQVRRKKLTPLHVVKHKEPRVFESPKQLLEHAQTKLTYTQSTDERTGSQGSQDALHGTYNAEAFQELTKWLADKGTEALSLGDFETDEYEDQSDNHTTGFVVEKSQIKPRPNPRQGMSKPERSFRSPRRRKESRDGFRKDAAGDYDMDMNEYGESDTVEPQVPPANYRSLAKMSTAAGWSVDDSVDHENVVKKLSRSVSPNRSLSPNVARLRQNNREPRRSDWISRDSSPLSETSNTFRINMDQMDVENFEEMNESDGGRSGFSP